MAASINVRDFDYEMSVDDVTMSGNYCAGETVISSFTVSHDSDYDITSDMGHSASFTAYYLKRKKERKMPLQIVRHDNSKKKEAAFAASLTDFMDLRRSTSCFAASAHPESRSCSGSARQICHGSLKNHCFGRSAYPRIRQTAHFCCLIQRCFVQP